MLLAGRRCSSLRAGPSVERTVPSLRSARQHCLPTNHRRVSWQLGDCEDGKALHTYASSNGRDRKSGSCRSSARPATTEDDVVRYASVGDVVSVHFVMREEDGKVLQSSATDLGEPLSFEVGAGDMMGNRLFQGFDEAVRGMAVGQTTVLEASGGEWRRELMFAVPREHPEVQRLEGRYKNHGGLAPGLVVELSNGGMAVVLEVGEAEVKLDANNMLAGKKFTIELDLVSIETPTPASADQ